AVVVVVAGEDRAEAIDARLVLVAEVVGDQFQVLAVEVAAPDRAGPAIGVVAGPLAALPVRRLQGVHAGFADAELELAVRSHQAAVDAVIVIVAAETGEQLLRRAVRLAVAVLVLENEDVRRMADVDAARNPSLMVGARRIRRDRDAKRGDKVRGLI